MSLHALLIVEGTSDLPLARLVEDEFRGSNKEVRITAPDMARLASKVGTDVESKVAAGLALLGDAPDCVIVHRDADSAGLAARRAEIAAACASASPRVPVISLIPVRMTEAWLLLDEQAIREVAGKPRGRVDLGLPRGAAVETCTDPKATLHESILAASEATGRRRKQLTQRFPQNRRQLLERLDVALLASVPSWQAVQAEVQRVAGLI